MHKLRFVTPDCCPTQSKHATIVLLLPFDVFSGVGGITDSDIPGWFVRGFNPEWPDGPSYFPAQGCPHCLTPVPAVRRRDVAPEMRIQSVTDGGYYCDTCDERLIACQCLPQEFLFEAVPGARGDRKDEDVCAALGESTNGDRNAGDGESTATKL